MKINKCICGVNNKMPGRDKLYVVSKEALSSVLLKTLHAKELLETKKVSSITEAIEKAQLSRGAFYKYKDLIMPFYDMQSEKKITFLMVLEDVKGVLSKILNIMAKYNVNVITINQNVPINKVANVTITVDTFDTKIKTKDLVTKIEGIDGVKKIDIISSGT
ncbi:MAG: ACT domain-containing protein [Ruminococcaceae bacterium]|nr:ACT domain-containing protein [Oscillospiraceae bacterium]